jgi:Mn2+/Fe2+ NRAMP family transporter
MRIPFAGQNKPLKGFAGVSVIEIPDIPSDANEDLDPLGTAETVPAGNDPDKAHTRKMEGFKLYFAIGVVVISVAIVVTLTLFQFFTQNQLTDSSGLSSAISWAQGLAATAAGFAFGRALSDGKSSE